MTPIIQRFPLEAALVAKPEWEKGVIGALLLARQLFSEYPALADGSLLDKWPDGVVPLDTWGDFLGKGLSEDHILEKWKAVLEAREQFDQVVEELCRQIQSVAKYQDIFGAADRGQAARIEDIAEALQHLHEKKSNAEAKSPYQKQFGDYPPVPLTDYVPQTPNNPSGDKSPDGQGY